MSRKVFLILFAGIVGALSTSHAQTIRRKCLTEQVNQPYREKLAMPASRAFEKMLSEKKTLQQSAFQWRAANTLYQLPVIVHVVHFGEEIGQGANLSNEQVHAQLEVLNEDFRRKTGTPGENTHPDGADMMIEFIPAPLDPQGFMLPVAGINRVDARLIDPLLNAADGISSNDVEKVIKPETIWDPEQYVNIWVVQFGRFDKDVLGYASFPVTTSLEGLDIDQMNLEQTDGLVINSVFFGSNDKGNFNIPAPYDRGRTLTHEMGHFLGLLHTWGDGGCEMDDFCVDTPASSGPTYNCPNQVNACEDGEYVMIENYMDYTDDLCMNTFTENQKSRMHVVLEESPRRKDLIYSSALSMEVTADFEPWLRTVYPGESVRFIDRSKGRIEQWSWSVTGPAEFSSAKQHPTFSFDNAGTYTVQLTVGNKEYTDLMEQPALIEVKEPVAGNAFPVMTENIPDQYLRWGDETTIDLSAYFDDPDKEALIFKAFSEDSAKVGVLVQGNELSLIGLATGQTKVNVRADDQRGGYLYAQLNAHVAYEPIALVKEMNENFYLPEDAVFEVDLNTLFFEPGGGALAYEIEKLQPAEASVIQVANELHVMYEEPGEISFTVKATDTQGTSIEVPVVLTAFEKPEIQEVGQIEISFDEYIRLVISDLYTTTDGRELDYVAIALDTDLVDLNDDEEGAISLEGLKTGEAKIRILFYDTQVNRTLYEQDIVVQVVEGDKARLHVFEQNTLLYPNPTDQYMKIVFDSYQDGAIELFVRDSRGALKKQVSVEKGLSGLDVTLDVRDYPAGIYFVEFYINGYRFHKKMIKL